ncbi:pantoate--beta-alanine ligase [Hydrogenothermus marinus]|uniref:Pantothenate synthetase n=1 Tax=Hydrogenothermus marinus TaxID=133270 RepID=A0A3M0C4N0_9AQUI|nr:pantoate--beta-alanine ligase [Hydrogenothermus marinus]RMA97892.1 pantoate--beta-alanine ligase [Hydrogenothermus marinus]
MLITDINQMKQISKNLKKEGKTIGFVPTMGYLHKGHISLMECSKKDNDITIVSIFVNPTQFGPNEDLDKYPRDLERDLKICKEVAVDYVFHPKAEDMYPEGYSTYVVMETLTDKLCGKFRPGHFKGVLTVVNKLFNIVKPDKAYFGKKDYQQYIVIKKMVEDLNMDVDIIGCPLIREKDGLAMSSRNKYLSQEERERALSISKALFKAKDLFEKGETNPKNLIKEMKKIMENNVDEIQYIEIVNPKNLEPKEKVEKGDIILVAAFVGSTRLIDNIEL